MLDPERVGFGDLAGNNRQYQLDVEASVVEADLELRYRETIRTEVAAEPRAAADADEGAGGRQGAVTARTWSRAQP